MGTETGNGVQFRKALCRGSLASVVPRVICSSWKSFGGRETWPLNGALNSEGFLARPVNAVPWIVVRNVALAFGILVLLHLLFVLLCREWVKTDVRRHAFVPIRIRWRPLGSSQLSCAFSVVYEDWEGKVCHAWARTSWYRREVTWAGQWPTEDSWTRGRRD